MNPFTLRTFWLALILPLLAGGCADDPATSRNGGGLHPFAPGDDKVAVFDERELPGPLQCLSQSDDPLQTFLGYFAGFDLAEIIF